MTHGKIYKLKRGKKVHVGDIDGGFLQALLPIFGPMVGELLSGVAKKVFGEGQHMLEFEGHGFMLPETTAHKKGGKGILDIIGSIFKPILGLLGGEQGDSSEDEGGASFAAGASFGASKAGKASFAAGSLNGTFGQSADARKLAGATFSSGGASTAASKAGKASFGKASFSSGTEKTATGSKKKKLPISATGVKSINLNRIQNPLPIVSSQGGRIGKGKQLGVEPIDIFRLA